MRVSNWDSELDGRTVRRTMSPSPAATQMLLVDIDLGADLGAIGAEMIGGV